MANVLADGLSWLAGQMKASASTTITYKRGASSVSIDATFGSQVLRVSDRDGNSKVERPDADFIFTAADLNFGSGEVEPDAGDYIEATFGSTTKRFQLMPMNNGAEPAWRYCDPHQLMVRCHTKYVGDV
jgi:hypothetical protein